MSNRNDRTARRVRARRLVALGTVAATGIAAGLATAQAASADGAKPHHQAAAAPMVLAQLAAAAGGEGGEAGERGHAEARDGDAEFLADLGLIEGHLRAGIALYEAGEAAMARTHMKHPGDEIYAELLPGLKARDAEDFSDELAELAAAVEGGAPAAKAREVFEEVLHEIEEAREHTGGGDEARLGAIVRMVRVAADEYAVGVVDHKVVEPHEYQDAWGFLQAAREMNGELAESGRAEVREAAEKIAAQLDIAEAGFAGVVPPETVAEDASLLYGAAARIELAALAVK